MSAIRKYPFIDDVINKLSLAQKQALINVMNTAGNNVEASLLNMPAKGITPVLFKLDEANLKTGILIYVDDVPVTLIAYHRFQDVLLFELHPESTSYKKVNEYCDINELRRLLTVGEEVSAGEIDSGNSTANQVLASDGNHGAVWKDTTDTIKEDNVEEGDVVKLFGFDSEGNLVQDDVPSGILVDDSVIEDSPNAVSGGAVYDELHDNYYNKTEADALLEEKANVDGNYPTMTVGVADQLSPYDDESGDDQDEPFSFQATGTGNGSQPDFATGSIALMKEKQGNTVVVNQLAKELNTTNWATSDGSTTYSDGVATFTASARGGTLALNVSNSTTVGHKYLIFADIKLTTGTTDVKVAFGYSSNDIALQTASNTNKQTLYGVGEKTSANSTTCWLYLIDMRTSDWDAIQLSNVGLIDLTQWFGSNDAIPADLLSHPEDFFRYYQGSLAYNEGTLVNANGRYVKCIGRNQWDEEYEQGVFYSNGTINDEANGIVSKNYIKVVPNKTYYVKCSSAIIAEYDKDKNFIRVQYRGNETFTLSSNACYIKFSTANTYGTTYNHDITISLYYEGESGYDQYYPYEVLTNNDTGNEVLLAFDYKTSDGVIHHNTVPEIDLGDLDWSYGNVGGTNMFYSTSAQLRTVAKFHGKAKCSSFICTTKQEASLGDKELTLGNTSNYVVIYINDSSYVDADTFKTAMSGVKIQVEAAEPITEQGTPFSENLVIDDFGSMDFSGTNGVPQGNLIFYPVDYKAFIDTLYDYTEGTPSELALKSDIKKYYVHNISIDGTKAEHSEVHIALSFITNSNDSYNTIRKLYTIVNSMMSNSESNCIPVTGAILYTSTSAVHIAQKITYNNTAIRIMTIRPDGTQGNFELLGYEDVATITVNDYTQEIDVLGE